MSHNNTFRTRPENIAQLGRRSEIENFESKLFAFCAVIEALFSRLNFADDKPRPVKLRPLDILIKMWRGLHFFFSGFQFNPYNHLPPNFKLSPVPAPIFKENPPTEYY